MILIPGVSDPKSKFIEHPEVVAQRIEAVVAAAGDAERIIAWRRLRLRQLRRLAVDRRRCRLDEAQLVARRRRYRLRPAVGQEGRVIKQQQ